MAHMRTTIPPATEVQELLRALSAPLLERVASESGVPMTTIYKIRNGTTTNPGLETVRKFLPIAQRIRKAAA